jgi:FkbH-like protein
MSHATELDLRMAIRSSKLTRELLDRFTDEALFYENTERKRIRVWRNFNFESIGKAVQILLRESALEFEWTLSGYDDSLGFTPELGGEFDLDIIWVDVSKFRGVGKEKKNWLESRIQDLKSKTRIGKILVFTIGIEEEVESHLHFRIEDILSEQYLNDKRMYSLFGTQISDEGQLIYSKFLSLQLFPSYFGILRKVIAVDMDETLHKGILGEDGIDGVDVTSQHLDFQRYLVSLKKQGYFLILVTKNHIDDVLTLLKSERYILKDVDFIKIYSGWEPKYEYINLALEELNLAPESVVFVDDNEGELFSFQRRFPTADLVKAEPDASITKIRILYTPGIFQINEDLSGEQRYQDIKANSRRRALSDSLSHKEAYLELLKPQLKFIKDSRVDLDRFAVQSYRTNQFNLNLTKYSKESLAKLQATSQLHLFQFEYSDSFGDSGIVGSSLCKLAENVLKISDLFISCRTLGRGIEFEILEEFFHFLSLNFPQVDSFEISWTRGPRNQPSMRWLEIKSDQEIVGNKGEVKMKCDRFAKTTIFEVIEN